MEVEIPIFLPKSEAQTPILAASDSDLSENSEILSDLSCMYSDLFRLFIRDQSRT